MIPEGFWIAMLIVGVAALGSFLIWMWKVMFNEKEVSPGIPESLNSS